MEKFQLTKEFEEELLAQIVAERVDELEPVLERIHAADIAEIFDILTLEQAIYITSLISNEKKVDVLAELEPDVRLRFFKGYSNEQIAHQFIQYMDSDDAADVLSEVDTDHCAEILTLLPDNAQSLLISTLLRYPVDSAGGLMAGELVKVNINWDVARCTEEIREQAEEVSKVYTVYVVDENNILLGWVSLKKIILAKATTPISEIFDSNVIYGNVHDDAEDIANTMNKYDLVAMPIADSLKRLVGRVTIDDVVDFIKEEADKDYQMLSGISSNVAITDKIWILSRARLPWLVIGLMGGVFSSMLIGSFEGEIARNVSLAFFMPLVMAMGGNAGVQSSSIVVQGLANNTLGSTPILHRLAKEFLVALINSLVCSALVLVYGLVSGIGTEITVVVSISLLSAIIFASLMGSFIPLILDRFKIDPALATGPFITTSNDLIGLFLYFLIGNLILS